MSVIESVIVCGSTTFGLGAETSRLPACLIVFYYLRVNEVKLFINVGLTL